MERKTVQYLDNRPSDDATVQSLFETLVNDTNSFFWACMGLFSSVNPFFVLLCLFGICFFIFVLSL